MFNPEEVVSEVRGRGAKKVLIQVPDGLKTRVQELAACLEQDGITAIISGEPCYGACDTRDHEARMLGCDLLLQLGHSDLGSKTEVPVLYHECRVAFDPTALLEAGLEKLKPYGRIALLTTIQYIDSLVPARKVLEANSKKVFIGQPNHSSNPGQVLGCDQSAALSVEPLVDCFIFLGSGLFHPLGLAVRTGKPVFFLDFERGRLSELDAEKDRLERIRFAHRAKAEGCKTFGILVSSKLGQFHPKTADVVKKKLEDKGRKAWIIVMDEISPAKLLGLNLDCLVNCSCPRLTSDFGMFKKPILDPEDIDGLVFE